MLVVVVRVGGSLAAARTRFREFVDLHKALRQSGVSTKLLPRLPPKTLPFVKSTSEQFQANRRALLGAYATELLQRTLLNGRCIVNPLPTYACHVTDV